MIRLTQVFCAAAAVCLAGALPAAASASNYTLPRTTVTATVQADGAVEVVEEHTFHFTAEGHGAYVDIPTGGKRMVLDAAISEGGAPYRESGTAELGVDRPPSTFAQRDCSGTHRVVWYFSALPGADRVFTLKYRLQGAVRVSDKYAMLHLPVWGKNWDPTLEQLSVSVKLPGKGAVQAFGQPQGVLKAKPGARVATASASDVAGGRTLAVDVVFPRKSLKADVSSTESKSSAAAELKTLRSGREVEDDSVGSGCIDSHEASTLAGDSRGGSSSSGGFGFVVLFVAIAVLAVIVNKFRGGSGDSSSGYRRYHHHHHTSHSSSFSSSSGSSSSDSGGSSSSSSGGGGGGGAW